MIWVIGGGALVRGGLLVTLALKIRRLGAGMPAV